MCMSRGRTALVRRRCNRCRGVNTTPAHVEPGQLPSVTRSVMVRSSSTAADACASSRHVPPSMVRGGCCKKTGNSRQPATHRATVNGQKNGQNATRCCERHPGNSCRIPLRTPGSIRRRLLAIADFNTSTNETPRIRLDSRPDTRIVVRPPLERDVQANLESVLSPAVVVLKQQHHPFVHEWMRFR